MPIYEFQCNKCGTVFERLTRDRNIKTTSCKNCGDTSASRIMSTTAKPKFNGSGFYETDYKNR